jgi:hypothetical protein
MSDDEKVKYVLEVDIPGLNNEAEIEIPGLGVYKNQDTYEVTEAQAAYFRAQTSTAEPVMNKDNVITHSEVTQGKTLLQQSRSMVPGISVTTYHPDDDQEEEDDVPDEEPDEGQQLVETPAQQLEEPGDLDEDDDEVND